MTSASRIIAICRQVVSTARARLTGRDSIPAPLPMKVERPEWQLPDPFRNILIAVRNNPRHRRPVFEQNERHVLVMGAVYAIGKIPRRLSHADLLIHKIRLYDFAPIKSTCLREPVVAQFEPCIPRGVIPKSPRFCQRAEGSPVAHSVVAEILRPAWRTATLSLAISIRPGTLSTPLTIGSPGIPP